MDNKLQNVKLSTKTPPLKLTNTSVILLIASQFLNLSLLHQQLSWWLIVVTGLCLLTTTVTFVKDNRSQKTDKYQTTQFSKILPSWLLTLIALSGCIILAVLGKQSGLLLSMVHLLCFAYLLKAFDMKCRRDFFEMILLGFFLITTSLIFNQSIIFSSLVIFAMTINFSLLLSYFTRVNMTSTVKISASILLKSVPLAVVLFVVFPRLSPFWQVPLAKSAKTGLSDVVKPGDIAYLARSNELAFRADFTDVNPIYSQLYWRSLVLDEYDGSSWKRSKSNTARAKEYLSGRKSYVPRVSGDSLEYQVIAEANFQPWLFALDVATIDVSSEIQALSDYSLRAVNPISQRLSYQVSSYPQTLLDKHLSEQQLKPFLSFPKNANPKLQQEALRLQTLYSLKIKIVEAVLSQIRQQEFYYTLEPPLLISNNLDQFYFNTKAGFCVHYASAYAFLMRAAGIPARLVTGYLGGEYNSQGNYFSIYQYDAHAWVEVWLEGKGWQRIDPTSAVAPERVESGLSSLLREQQRSLNDSFFSLHNYKHLTWLNSLRLQLDALDYQWARWVVGYSAKRQYDFLNRLFGQVQLWKSISVIVVSLTTIMLMLWWLNSRGKKAVKITPWLALYEKSLIILAKKGIDKPHGNTAREYAEKVAEIQPELADDFSSLTTSFEKLTYQNLSINKRKQLLFYMKEQLAVLKRLVRKN